MADPRPAGERGESIRAEANRRGVTEWQVRKDRGETHGPRSSSADRVHTAFRLPEDLHARLQAEAEDRDLSMNYLVTKAIEEFLADLIPTREFRLTRDRNSEPPKSQPAELGNEE